MRFEKKVWPEFFQSVLDGMKTYDLRLADFTISPGDILVLREWDPISKAYTGRKIEKNVTYIGKTKGTPFWPADQIEKYGFQIIAFK
ncbi:MAG: DUF3850 domain-containing protein [Candidatus Diapherotrites archaeon]|nr:DUF3850 domain-containing protein [Candidatus Diapherotrites archaeon]MDZ4256170.1 DUF3850 domain-containing protein [archaeon]